MRALSRSHAPTALLLILAVVGCSRAGDRKPAKALPGQACHVRSDCVSNAPCWYGTCELPGPCTSRYQILDTGKEQLHRYRYSDRGDEIERMETEDGETRMLVRTEYDYDQRRYTMKLWPDGDESQPPMNVVEAEFGDEMRPLVERSYDPAEPDEVQIRRFHWDRANGCSRAPATTYKKDESQVVGRFEVTCNERGQPTTSTQIDAEHDPPRTIRSMSYHYDDNGRLATRTDELSLLPDEPPRTYVLNFVRDERGVIIGFTGDNDGDGEIDWRDTFDVSCWQVSKSGITLEQGI